MGAGAMEAVSTKSPSGCCESFPTANRNPARIRQEAFSDLIKASVANGEEFSSIQQACDQSTIESQLTVGSK
jgi:pectin methylesterase-like acyl-CoA thioesterase